MERSNGKVAALFSETYEGDEDDTLNNGASQLARSRCFSFFFFLHAREFHPPGDVFTLFEAKKERCRRNLNLLLDPGLLSQRSQGKNEIDEIHPFDIISSLYRLISNTYSTPLGHPVDIAIKSR